MSIPVQKSGKVVLDDGTPPPESVIVEATCGGRAVPIARTDSKGGFIVGRGRDADVDASLQSGAIGSGVAAGCVLSARLPGYQSSGLRVADSEAIDLGTIILSRPAGVEGTVYSVTSMQAPKAAQKAFEKAKTALEKKKVDEARPQLEKAVELYPRFAAAWCELGRIYQSSGDQAKALDAYQKSIKADPKFIKPYLNMAGILHKQQNWQAVVVTTSTVIKLDPYSYVAAYVLNAIAYMRLGNASAAEASAKLAVKLDTPHMFPEAEYTLAMILDGRGDAAGALEHLRAYLQYAPKSPGAEAVKGRIAELEQASGAKPAAPQAAKQ